jgi:small subunit ribosomal protein S18
MQKRNSRKTDRDNRDRDIMPARKRVRILDPNDIVDINNVELLRRFVTEYGKIVPARLTGITAAQQRQVKQGVRRARNMGLMA